MCLQASVEAASFRFLHLVRWAPFAEQSSKRSLEDRGALTLEGAALSDKTVTGGVLVPPGLGAKCLWDEVLVLLG